MESRRGEGGLTLRLARSLVGPTTLVAVVLAVAGPLSWFVLRYDELRRETLGYAQHLSQELSAFAEESPGLWVYNTAKIAERVGDLYGPSEERIVRVFDARGRMVHHSGPAVRCSVWAEVPLTRDGPRAGTVLVGLPSLPVLWTGLILLGCFAVIGAASGAFLYIFPLLLLARAEERLRRTIGRLETERERRRIGRELHDSTGQMLTAVRLNLEAAGQLVDCENDPSLKEVIEDTASLTDGAIAAMRDMVNSLETPPFRPGGLAQAVQAMMEQFERSGCSLESRFDSPELAAVTHAGEICAFRVIQEGVTNAVRHAAPCAVRIKLAGGDEGLTIEVQDDGPGALIREGQGLRGMRERVALLGGRLSIHSEPGRGVRLSAFLPGVSATATSDLEGEHEHSWS